MVDVGEHVVACSFTDERGGQNHNVEVVVWGGHFREDEDDDLGVQLAALNSLYDFEPLLEGTFMFNSKLLKKANEIGWSATTDYPHEPNSELYQVYLDREVAAPGTKYTDNASKSEEFNRFMAEAGLGQLIPKAFSVGYSDITFAFTDRNDALAVAKKLDATLPPASEGYKNEYLEGTNKHHVDVQAVPVDENGEETPSGESIY